MEIERIFSPEQIKVQPELPKILKEYTKAVIRANPDDLLEYSYNYFKEKVEADEQEKLKQWKEANELNQQDIENI